GDVAHVGGGAGPAGGLAAAEDAGLGEHGRRRADGGDQSSVGFHGAGQPVQAGEIVEPGRAGAAGEDQGVVGPLAVAVLPADVRAHGDVVGAGDLGGAIAGGDDLDPRAAQDVDGGDGLGFLESGDDG